MRTGLKKFLCVFSTALVGVSGILLPYAYAGQNESLGTFSGAAIGGVIGNQFGHGGGRVAATATGALAGGFIGNRIGASYDHPPRVSPGAYYYPYETSYYYPNTYVPNYVAPPAPPPTYVDDHSGGYCREYSEPVRIGDRVQESYGTACLQPDGTWRVIDQ